MNKVKKLLFITNAEFGQASIHVSIIRELFSRDNGDESFEIHLLSFPALKARVSDLLEASTSTSTSKNKVRFHSLTGAPSFVQKHEQENQSMANFIRHEAGFWGAIQSFSKVGKTCLPWTGQEYVKLYRECFQVIQETRPDLALVDVIFFPGFDACIGIGQPYVILSPTPFRGDQSLMRTFSYPAVSSGYPFPVPLLLKPLNFLLLIIMILSGVYGKVYDITRKARKENGITHLFPSITTPKKVLTISASAQACDFPFTPDPNLSLPVGPIVQPIHSVQALDPELHSFISKKPTILIALGSHVQTTLKMSVELSLGLKKVLDKRKDVQVLWKVRKPLNFDPMQSIEKILGPELKEGRIKTLSWLNVDPISILSSGFISCFVHHGGANSFLESVYAGVPQVIMSCWYDTMEFGAKVEYLKIGSCGNRKSAPEAEAVEFSESLFKVIGDGSPAGERMAREVKRKAVEVGEKSRAEGGAKRAGDKILELA